MLSYYQVYGPCGRRFAIAIFCTVRRVPRPRGGAPDVTLRVVPAVVWGERWTSTLAVAREATGTILLQSCPDWTGASS